MSGRRSRPAWAWEAYRWLPVESSRSTGFTITPSQIIAVNKNAPNLLEALHFVDWLLNSPAVAADELVNKLENGLRTMSGRKQKKWFLIFG